MVNPGDAVYKRGGAPLLLIILLHILWFATSLFWKNYYNGDSYEYTYLAENITKCFYYSGNPALPLEEFRLSLRTPVYALFIMLFYSLFGYNTLIILLAQNVLSILSCWLAYTFFQKKRATLRFTWVYWILTAMYPAQFFFADMLAPDILLQFFLILYFRDLISYLQEKTGKKMALMSIWLLLATLTKPVVYPYLLFHLLFAVIESIRIRKVALFLLGALPLMAMLGYGAWNQKRTGLFHISSIQSINLLEYNVHLFLTSKQGKPYADSFLSAEKEHIYKLSSLEERYIYASQKAKEIIFRDLPGYTTFHLRESMRFFIEPGKSELDLFTGYLGYDFKSKENFRDAYHNDGLKGAFRYLIKYPLLPVILLVVLFNFIRFIGFILFLFSSKIPVVLRLLAGIFVFYFALVTGPVANTRYFLPVLLILNSCCLVSYSLLFKQIKLRSKSTYEQNSAEDS